MSAKDGASRFVEWLDEKPENREHHAESCRSWRETNPEYSTEHARRYRAADPLRYEAHKRVRTATRNGTLVRPAECQSCGKACKPDAHHADYSKPLEVTWLCRACHRAGHTYAPELANPSQPRESAA